MPKLNSNPSGVRFNISVWVSKWKSLENATHCDSQNENTQLILASYFGNSMNIAGLCVLILCCSDQTMRILCHKSAYIMLIRTPAHINGFARENRIGFGAYHKLSDLSLYLECWYHVTYYFWQMWNVKQCSWNNETISWNLSRYLKQEFP